MHNADEIRVECDERGFELHVLDDEGEWHIFNIHGCAEALYDSVRSTIGPWLQEAAEARRTMPTRFGQTFYREDAERLFGHCTCPDDSGSCDYCRVYYNGPDEGDEPLLGESAFDYYRRTGHDEPLRAMADLARKREREDLPDDEGPTGVAGFLSGRYR